jgi:hypothetical protein
VEAPKVLANSPRSPDEAYVSSGDLRFGYYLQIASSHIEADVMGKAEPHGPISPPTRASSSRCSIIEPPLPNKPRGMARSTIGRCSTAFTGGLRGGWDEIPERYGPSTARYNPLRPVGQDRRLGSDI